MRRNTFGSQPMNRLTTLAFAAAALGIAATAQANGRNFFNRGGVALYNPVVDVVNSGARLVAAPTVSADRKYVTVSAQPQLSQIVSIANFPVARGFGGFVGGVAPADGGQPAQPGAALNRPGMTFLGNP
jgi:hypothetical protein